jgi:hypothetical protein
MTPEELELYRDEGLQKFFREKMGEWQAGDWGWHIGVCDTFLFIYPQGELLMVYWKGHYSLKDVFRSNAIRLPLPIDPVNPERGLWGMIENLLGVDRITEVWREGWVATIRDAKDPEGNLYCLGSTPTLALLKALKAQEGK